jgi:pimeloyl-ACP methyl ester carboxylesterase
MRQDHLTDLESILSAEGVSRCDVIGWCTGAKLAIEFCRRDPARVRAMIFLNGTLKCGAYCDEEETSYERNLEQLCRAVDSHPELAGMLKSALGSPTRPALDLDEAESSEVMALSNIRLADLALHPFRSEASAVVYARQILDFLSHDVRPVVHEVDAPVLWIGCEHDRIASPRSARKASAWLPQCRYVEVHGATHYCLFDRPRIAAGLINRFLSNPDAALSGTSVPARPAPIMA